MKKKEIIRKTRKWAEVLCCNEIDLDLVFRKFTKEELHKDGNFEAVAQTESNSRYMEATITFNTDKLDQVNDETIVHEILHIKLAELTGYLYANETEAIADKWKGYFEERFVSQMSKILTRHFYKTNR